MTQFDLPNFDACVMDNNYAAADPKLGFVAVPGSEIAGFKVNKHGLRGPVLPVKKAPGHFRILFIGDSTCWGLGVQLEDTFAARASRFIAEDNPESKIEYIIGALPGYSSYQSKIMLDRLLPMKTDLVVFYVGANNDHTRARYYKDADIPARAARLHTTWHHIRLLRAIESINDILYRKFLRKLRSRDARARVPIIEFHNNMIEMINKVIKSGVEALILIPPYSEQRLKRRPTIPKYQDSLKTVAKEFNIPYIKLQEKFNSEEENLIYFPDLYHFREFGHEITAQEIRRVVAEERIVELTLSSDTILSVP
ncbi:MAG: SGNH/GDSL hydrolase family protein [Candidatus Scalinduaceae bacterium]